ncbi:hypothetical protein R1sor_005704 [Riccia sorocarpa]|uniref:Uncharacterized protein n=1 Tax=Riccia sorocarpa TaxID=122646 RepID=A0ABD3HKY9_9MARC
MLGNGVHPPARGMAFKKRRLSVAAEIVRVRAVLLRGRICREGHSVGFLTEIRKISAVEAREPGPRKRFRTRRGLQQREKRYTMGPRRMVECIEHRVPRTYLLPEIFDLTGAKFRLPKSAWFQFPLGTEYGMGRRPPLQNGFGFGLPPLAPFGKVMKLVGGWFQFPIRIDFTSSFELVTPQCVRKFDPVTVHLPELTNYHLYSYDEVEYAYRRKKKSGEPFLEFWLGTFLEYEFLDGAYYMTLKPQKINFTG